MGRQPGSCATLPWPSRPEEWNTAVELGSPMLRTPHMTDWLELVCSFLNWDYCAAWSCWLLTKLNFSQIWENRVAVLSRSISNFDTADRRRFKTNTIWTCLEDTAFPWTHLYLATGVYLGLEIHIALLDLAKVLNKALGLFTVIVCYFFSSCYITLQTVIFMLLFLGKCRKIAFTVSIHCRKINQENPHNTISSS